MSPSYSPPVGTQAERDLDSNLDKAITSSSSLIEEALAQLAKPCIAPGDQEKSNEKTAEAEAEAASTDIDSRLDTAITSSSALLEEALRQLAMPCTAPEEDHLTKEDDLLTPIYLDSRLDKALTSSSSLLSEALAQLAKPSTAALDLDKEAEEPPLQSPTTLNTRLDNAITTSSSLIESALAQLAMPCTVPENETDEEEDFDILTPLDIALSKSTTLLEEAQFQLTSPRFASLEFTQSELSESKTAENWSRTYHQISQTNDVRADASEDLANSIIKDIDEAAQSGVLADELPQRPVVKMLSMSDVREEEKREEKRAKRLSRVCGGPRVAAVVAKIEAIDDGEVVQPQRIVSKMVYVGDN